jgi:hypothetical protein
MSEELVNMTYRLSDGTETTYLVELQPESDYSLMNKKVFEAGVEAERQRIIRLLTSNEWLWRERVAYDALIALIKGEDN